MSSNLLKMSENIRDLGSAMVLHAIVDWQDSNRRLKKITVNDVKTCLAKKIEADALIHRLQEIEDFLESEWCAAMCGFDTGFIVDRLDSIVVDRAYL